MLRFSRLSEHVLPLLVATAFVGALVPTISPIGVASAAVGELGTLRAVANVVTEGTPTGVSVRTSLASSSDTTLRLRPVGGTATEGLDYEPFDVEVVVSAGATQSNAVTLVTIDDEVSDRYVETIEMGIFDPTDPNPDAAPLAVSNLRVVDNDPVLEFVRPAEQAGDPARTLVVEEPTSGTLDVVVPVRARGDGFPYDAFATASVFVTDLGDALAPSATLGVDVLVADVSWDDDDAEVPSLTLRIVADGDLEGSERIRLALRHELNCDCGWYDGDDDVLDLTIVDPSVEPFVFSSATPDDVVGEGDVTAEVGVRFESPGDRSASVRIVAEPVTADATADFEPVDISLVLDQASPTTTFDVTLVDDDIRELQLETFEVRVFHLDSGAPDASTTAVFVETISIEDDEPQVEFVDDTIIVVEPEVGSNTVTIPLNVLDDDWVFADDFVTVRGEFVDPDLAALDVEWVRDVETFNRFAPAAPLLLAVLPPADGDREQVEIVLRRTPRLASASTPDFVDDTLIVRIDRPVDPVADPADELRAALAEIEAGFATWTPPGLDLTAPLGGPIPVLGDPGDVFDLAAGAVGLAFGEFDPTADALDAALDDFEAKGCVTDFVADGIGGRTPAVGDDVVQLSCTTSISQLAPTAVERLDAAIDAAGARLVDGPELTGDLTMSGDLEAVVTVGLDADGVYVGGQSRVVVDASLTGLLAGGELSGDASAEVDIAISLDPVGFEGDPTRIRLGDLDDRLASGPSVTLDGRGTVRLALDTEVLDLEGIYEATIAVADGVHVLTDSFEATGSLTVPLPGADADGGAGADGDVVVAVSGVADGSTLALTGTVSDTAGLDLLGVQIARLEVDIVVDPPAAPEIGVELELAVDATGWGATDPISVDVRARLLDGELSGSAELAGDTMTLGIVEFSGWGIVVDVDTGAALPADRLTIGISAAELVVGTDLDDPLVRAQDITGHADAAGLDLQLGTVSIGAENSPFRIDATGVDIRTPGADGVLMNVGEASATVVGFGENITATVTDLTIDRDLRVGLSSFELDRGDLEETSSLLAVIPVQLQSIRFDFETDVDGFIPDLGRFTISATATIPTDAFDDWPVEPVITLGGATIGPETPADERSVSISARVLSVDPLQILPVDVGPIGIGLSDVTIGAVTIDVSLVAGGYVGGELQPTITGTITVDTGLDVLTQAGAQVTGEIVLDDSGAASGLVLDSRFSVDLDLAAGGAGVEVDDLALAVSARFGSASENGSPVELAAVGLEAARVDFDFGTYLTGSATDIEFDVGAAIDGAGVLFSIGGDLADGDSGATLRVGDAFGGFAGWGGRVGNVGITADGQLTALDGFYVGVVAPDDRTTTFGIPDWLPVRVNEVTAGFGSPPAPVGRLARSGDSGFAPIDLLPGTPIDATLIDSMKLRVSATLGGGAVPASFEVDGLVVDFAALLEYDFDRPFRFDELPVENLDSITAVVEPIDLGAVKLGGELGFGSALVETPDGPREVLYLRIGGQLESSVISGGATMVVSELGPVLLKVTAPLGLPLGPTGFVLTDATGAATFGADPIDAPEPGRPEDLIDALDGSLPTDAALDATAIAEAIGTAAARGVPTWELGGVLAVSGRLVHVAVPGLAEGDVTLAATFGPLVDGALVPGTQLIGTGEISVTGIDLFGVIDGGEVASAGVLFDLSDPSAPGIDLAFRAPTPGSPMELLFPASISIAAQLDLTGVVEATSAGFTELADSAPEVFDALAAFTLTNPDSALSRALATVEEGNLLERLRTLLRSDPATVISELLPALVTSGADLTDLLVEIRSGARAAVLAADSVFDPSFVFTGALQPQFLGLAIGDPAADVTVVVNKDAVAFQVSGSLIESIQQATRPFLGELPILLFQLSTLDMTDRTDVTVQIPLPQMQRVLLEGGELPPIDPNDSKRFSIGLSGSLSIAGSTVQFGGFYTAPENRAVLDTLVQKRFELPADTPVDPQRVPITDREDYDRLLADGGFVLAGRALVPRIVTDPVGVVEDIGPFPTSPIEIGEWFDSIGDAVAGVDDPISAVLVIPTLPSLLDDPREVLLRVRNWAPTVTFTGVFDGTARSPGGERTTRLLSLPIGIGEVRATIRGIEVTAAVPLAGGEATFVASVSPRPTGATDRLGRPIMADRPGAALDVSLSSAAAVRSALSAIGLPAGWAPSSVGARLDLQAYTPGFDLASTDPLARRGGVRASARIDRPPIVEDAAATIEILPGSRPGVPSFVDPDFSFAATSTSVDLGPIALDDIEVELAKSGSTFSGRIGAGVTFDIPGVAAQRIEIDENFTGSSDLSFGYVRSVEVLGQSLGVDLDVSIVGGDVSIEGSASGAFSIGGVPLASGSFDVNLASGVLRLSIPEDDPLIGRLYGIGGAEMVGWIDTSGEFALDGTLEARGAVPGVAWSGTVSASVARTAGGTTSTTGRFVGAVTAGGVRGDVDAGIVRRADGRGLVSGAVSVDLDGDGDTAGVPLPLGGAVPESAAFSFVLGVPAPPDILPPSFAALADVDIQVTPGTLSVPVWFEQPIAIDDRDGSVAATCTPAPGDFVSAFGGGVDVSCTATDAAGNQAEAGFRIAISTAPAPEIEIPDLSGPSFEVTLCCFTSVAVSAVVFSEPTPLGDYAADARGVVAIAATLPPLEVGGHHLIAFGTGPGGTPLQIVVPLTVGSDGRLSHVDGRTLADLSPSVPIGLLPSTGLGGLAPLRAGLVFVAIGAMFLALRRRRWRPAS